jgi:hypothetical protein
MERIPVRNDTAMPIYVGAHMVPPGETGLFFPDQVPPHLRPVPDVPVVEAEPVDAVAELFKGKGKAKDIIAALPELSNEQLDQLAALEQARGAEARSTVLGAISELVLQRAEDGDDTPTGGNGSDTE